MNEFTKEQLLQIIEDQKAKIKDLEENFAIVTLEACSLRHQLKNERAFHQRRSVRD